MHNLECEMLRLCRWDIPASLIEEIFLQEAGIALNDSFEKRRFPKLTDCRSGRDLAIDKITLSEESFLQLLMSKLFISLQLFNSPMKASSPTLVPDKSKLFSCGQ